MTYDISDVSRSTSLAYRSGVTYGVSSPKSSGFLSGWGTAFGLGAGHRMETSAVLQEKTAIHVSVGTQGRQPSISSQIAALRELLLKGEHGPFRDVADVSPFLFPLQGCRLDNPLRVRSPWSSKHGVPMSSPHY